MKNNEIKNTSIMLWSVLDSGYDLKNKVNNILTVVGCFSLVDSWLPVTLLDSSFKGLGHVFSKVPVTLRARNQIIKSKYKE